MRPLHRLGYKGAIITPRRTERNGHIQAEGLRAGMGQDFILNLQGAATQRKLLLADQQLFSKIGQRRLPAHLPYQTAQQLHRTHTGYQAPGLGKTQQIRQLPIQQRTQRQLAAIPICRSGRLGRRQRPVVGFQPHTTGQLRSR